jgi:hypothetical protein
MSVLRFLALGACLLGAACTNSTEEVNVDSDSAEYRSTFKSIHYCMTDASAHDDAGLVTWASVGVATRAGTAPFLTLSMHLNLTDQETATLRESSPYTFTGGVSAQSTALQSATVDGKHYASADGTLTLDLDLNQRHMLDHGVVSAGRGTAKVTVDFGTTPAVLPARVRALGKKTFHLAMNDCN